MKKILIALLAAASLAAAFGLSACGSSGHTHSYTETVVDPTCTEQGYTLHSCSCGNSYQDTYTAALGHTVVVDEAVEATCTQSGLTAGSHCSVCGAVLTAQQTVEATGHTESDWIVEEEATCGEAGSRYKECTVCHEVLERETVEATGEHSWDEGVVLVDATETSKGKVKYTCTVCGEEKIESTPKALTGGTSSSDPIIIQWDSDDNSATYERELSSRNGEWYSYTSSEGGTYILLLGEHVACYYYEGNSSQYTAHYSGINAITLSAGTSCLLNIYYYDANNYDDTNANAMYTGTVEFTFKQASAEGYTTADPRPIAEGESTVESGWYYQYTATRTGVLSVVTQAVNLYVYPNNKTTDYTRGSVTDRAVSTGDTVLIYLPSGDSCTVTITLTMYGTEDHPLTAQAGVNSEVTLETDAYSAEKDVYYLYYTYTCTATEEGTLYFAVSEGSVIGVSSESFTAAAALDGDAHFTVTEGQAFTCYIAVGKESGCGTCGFTVSFVAKYSTVTFETNQSGVEVEPQTVETGTYATKPTDPTCEGYTFVGWYKDSACTEEFSFDTVITGNTSLYAKWQKEECTVTFVTNKSGVTVDAQSVDWGAVATEPTTPTCEGYIFVGWYRDSDLTEEFSFTEAIQADITLYAKWVALGETVDYPLSLNDLLTDGEGTATLTKGLYYIYTADADGTVSFTVKTTSYIFEVNSTVMPSTGYRANATVTKEVSAGDTIIILYSGGTAQITVSFTSSEE